MDFESFIDIRRELHKIPELGFKEFKTQQLLLNYISNYKNERVEIKTWKTGIFVFLHGINPKKTIAYRTDMDGLPIIENTGLPFSSSHEGMMHACGHDFHMSIALGILTFFINNPVDNNLLFIFQPAEEGPGGAKPMIESEIYQLWKPDEIYALHVAPELKTGIVSTKTGTLFAACSEVDIKIIGKSSHGARPHLGTDTIVIASHLISQFQTIISRNLDPISASVLTIGEFHSGTARNIISDSAVLKGTIRALDSNGIEKIKSFMNRIISGVEASFNCLIEVSYNHEYVEVYNDELLTNSFIDFTRECCPNSFQLSDFAMTAEDFGFFLKDIPGMMFWLGVDSMSGLHTPTLIPDEKAIPFAIEFMIKFLTRN
jgi:N-acetyldiaminopimelate deacetylase